MPTRISRLLLALVVAGLAGACSREEVAAPPVATPSVTLSRSEAAIGSPVDVTYRFTVASDAPAFGEDFLVFAHFIDANGERMWTDDHEPPTPTLQWMPGQTVEYTRTIFIPKFPYTGPAYLDLGLYSRESGERLPLSGEDSGMRAYRVASFAMSLQSDNQFVIFKDGWHETESAEDSGLQWQWSKGEATFAFRNPKRDAELLLQVDQAVNALPEPQRVEVRRGDTTLDTFTVPAGGDRLLRRIALPADTLGGDETVELTMAVDRTFIPAEVASLRSTDTRELGVRVFRAFVEPK